MPPKDVSRWPKSKLKKAQCSSETSESFSSTDSDYESSTPSSSGRSSSSSSSVARSRAGTREVVSAAIAGALEAGFSTLTLQGVSLVATILKMQELPVGDSFVMPTPLPEFDSFHSDFVNFQNFWGSEFNDAFHFKAHRNNQEVHVRITRLHESSPILFNGVQEPGDEMAPFVQSSDDLNKALRKVSPGGESTIKVEPDFFRHFKKMTKKSKLMKEFTGTLRGTPEGFVYLRLKRAESRHEWMEKVGKAGIPL